jgi:disulfide bond formation protein DsbB
VNARNRRLALFGAMAVVPPGAVGMALITQHVFDMQPCPWCVLQRLIFLAIAVAALPGLVLASRGARWGSAAVVLVLAACGAATALWQHFVAAVSESCAMTFADRVMRGLGLDEILPPVFASYASCADGAARLFGVPYEFYSLTLFIGLGAAAVWALRSRHA